MAFMLAFARVRGWANRMVSLVQAQAHGIGQVDSRYKMRNSGVDGGVSGHVSKRDPCIILLDQHLLGLILKNDRRHLERLEARSFST